MNRKAELAMKRFSMHAFYAELDQQRRARGLSWTQLAAEINRPFETTPSIPISPGTLRDMLKKRSVTSAVVLQALRRLGRTPESFLSDLTRSANPNEQLPEVGLDRILRFDTHAIYEALQLERLRRDITWQQLANELPGFTASMLTNLENGPLIGFPRVMTLTQWLDLPAATFVRSRSR
jgi:transcriptional regulator with XRE-family HTH domain